MNILRYVVAAVAVAFAAPVAAVTVQPTTGYYTLNYDRTAGTATMQMAGEMRVAASSMTLGTTTVLINGTSGFIQAVSYASAPVVNVSTISSPLSQLNIYTSGGDRVMKFTSVAMIGTTPSAFTDSTLGTLDLYETTGGDLYLRRYDTSVAAGDNLGRITFRDRDSSTGGTSDKASITAEAAGDWGSGNPMEVGIHFGLDRYGGGHSRVLSVTSTGTYISYWQSAVDVPVSCGTCTLHVVSPSGSGIAVTGNIEVSSRAVLGTSSTGGTQLFYCAGGTFDGNVCRGTACICTGGTPTPLSIYVK